MVQGLAFLSKKSWHVKNMNNQEKVWMAEQRKEVENSKTKELARQIQQEREQDELDAISGKKTSHLDRGIAWMHEGGTGEVAKEDLRKKNEEYLMGKEYAPQGVKGGDFAVDGALDGVNAVMAGATAESVKMYPSQNGASVADKNEAFRMRHEDPMFLVSKRHDEQQAKAEKTKALYKRVAGSHEERNDDRKNAKRAKKERKRERKHRYREDDDLNHRKYPRRSRSRDRNDYKEDRTIRMRQNEPPWSRSRGEESPRQSMHDVHQQNNRSGGTNCDGKESFQRREYEHDGQPSELRSRLPDDSRYGLQGSSSKGITNGDLGPMHTVLAQKRQDREEVKRSVRDRASIRHVMTPEERIRVLGKMQMDASRRVLCQKSIPDSSDGAEAPSRGSATFLNDIKQQSHGINATDSLSLRIVEKYGKYQKLDDSFP